MNGNNNCLNCRECRQFERKNQQLEEIFKKDYCQRCGIKQERFFMDEFVNGKIVCQDQTSCQLRLLK